MHTSFALAIRVLGSWALAHAERTTIWRGTELFLTRDGRLVARESKP